MKETEKYKNIKYFVLAVSSIAAFLTPFMVSSMNVALPTLQKIFKANAVLLGMIENIYMTTTLITLILTGKLEEIYGCKKIFIAGTVIFAGASLGCATAPSIYVLLLMRALQGVGASFLMVSSMTLIVSVFPANERGMALGINSAAIYVSSSAGPYLSGLILMKLPWHTIFSIPAMVSIMAFVSSSIVLRNIDLGKNRQDKIDGKQFLLYAAAIILVVIGLSEIVSLHGILMTVTGTVMLVIFIRRELKSPDPILDLSLFLTNKVFAYSSAASCLNYMSVMGIGFLLSIFLQYIKGFSPFQAGLILLTQPLAQAVVSPLMGKLSDRIQPRYLATAGMIFIVTGLLALLPITPSSPVTHLQLVLVILGIGYGLFAAPNTNAIMSSVKPEQYEMASGMVAVIRSLGQLGGMTINTLVIAIILGKIQLGPQHTELIMKTMKTCLTIFTVICSCGIYFSFSRGNIREKKQA